MNPSRADDAGRVIAGLLGYNPGPGIYSRLERAVEAMPANVRVEELPGLLKRYKEGVPGWELKETDFPGLIGEAKVIPRQDLLDRVRQRSPVYTHSEVLLGEVPGEDFSNNIRARIGEGRIVERPVYKDYGQGGSDYRELLIRQPGAKSDQFGGHWWTAPGGNQAVAHARFDTHGDALRINELQSDLGIHNRKAREFDAAVEAADRAGNENELMFLSTQEQPAGYPFPLEDAWADILIKRLALEAARKGHRAIEIASPRAIADKVGGNIDNYEHFYGKVVPGAIERLGRKMGGVTEVASPMPKDPRLSYSAVLEEMSGNQPLSHAFAAMRLLREAAPRGPRPAFEVSTPGVAWNKVVAAYQGQGDVGEMAQLLHGALAVDLSRAGGDVAKADAMMPQLMRLAEDHAANMDRYSRVERLAAERAPNTPIPRASEAGRRYIMSDEMRKRILTQGIGASLLAPMAGAAMQEQ